MLEISSRSTDFSWSTMFDKSVGCRANFGGMDLGRHPSKIVSGDPDFKRRWPLKMSSNFNCSYMTMSTLTYILGFTVKFFFQYTDLHN